MKNSVNLIWRQKWSNNTRGFVWGHDPKSSKTERKKVSELLLNTLVWSRKDRKKVPQLPVLTLKFRVTISS